jgi:hypothetical protein
MTVDRRQQPTRPLSAAEQELIEALIGAVRSGVGRYLAQLERARVTGTCRCGCPSIDLEVSDASRRGRPLALVMADAESAGGVPVGVILWACNGELSSLEVHAWDGSMQVRLPEPETLANIRVRPK